MDTLRYEKIGEAGGRLMAEFFKSFLEAEGIEVELFQESYQQSSYVAPLSPVEIFVPRERAEAARLLLADYEEFQPEDEDDKEQAG